MRPLRLDLSAQADANGLATIPVKLPQTGEWHIVKMALRTSSAAQWLVLISGTEATYGAGRRVTLGPDLVQDGETMVLQVSGAVPGAAIAGAVLGVSGPPADMLAMFSPHPNTVSAQIMNPDEVQLFPVGATVTAQGQPSFTTLAGAVNVGNTFNLPAGCKAVRIAAHAPPPGNPFTWNLQVINNPATANSMLLWPQGGNPAARTAVLYPAVPVLVRVAPAWSPPAIPNPQIAIGVDGDPSVALNFYVSAVFDVETIDISSQAPVVIQQGVTNIFNSGHVAFATGVTTLLAAVAGKTYRIFDLAMFMDTAPAVPGVILQDGAGNDIQQITTPVTQIVTQKNGAPATLGQRIHFNNASGGSIVGIVTFGYSLT